MKSIYPICVAALALFCGCAQQCPSITVENDSNCNREELVEIRYADLNISTRPSDIGLFDALGEPVPFQFTSDSLIVFMAKIKAYDKAHYRIMKGLSPKVDTITSGKLYPEHNDDIAWENDRMAYRAFGPAMQHFNDMNFGYDVWVKNTKKPVIRNRYFNEQKYNTDYHINNGDGCDCYQSGPTLGCGATALMANDGSIIYPSCCFRYELLDNGPLRFKVRLTCQPQIVGAQQITETRVITLDAGSNLNKTEVTYSGLTDSTHVIAGPVLHTLADSTIRIDEKLQFAAHADPTQNPEANNGTIFTGVLFPSPADSISIITMDEEEAEMRMACGHVVGHTSYQPGSHLTYWWGAGWSYWGFNSIDEWTDYLKTEAYRIDHPLTITIEL